MGFAGLVEEGLEYYALKNLGIDYASGDLVCFLDSDVHPDAGWLSHLLGSFSREDINAAAGQPYVAPVDLFSRAFALGWTYNLADQTGCTVQVRKFYANNLVVRKTLLREVRFTPLKLRTRGAASVFEHDLRKRGDAIWEVRRAHVDHPAPSSLHHLIVRALAHGRDSYMKKGEYRSLGGFLHCQKTAAQRFARGVTRTFHLRREVELRAIEIPVVLAIITTYFSLFSLGGVLTHLSPTAMGHRFRL